eukprot:3723888-Prymnesium_polylepis.1
MHTRHSREAMVPSLRALSRKPRAKRRRGMEAAARAAVGGAALQVRWRGCTAGSHGAPHGCRGCRTPGR